MYKRVAVIFLLLGFGLAFASGPGPRDETCSAVVHALNLKLPEKIDEAELVHILMSLKTARWLPATFVSKAQARSLGWKPGQDLWKNKKLYGKSIGGDRFQNREKKLPNIKHVYYEADLDYKGGKRNAKRLIFTREGRCYVTVDHYQTFTEVPPCR